MAFATFWYNDIGEDVFTFSVQTVGPSGVGQYTVSSQARGGLLYNVTFGTVSGLSTQVQWPSGVQNEPDAFLTGAGNPVAETVTVQFLDSVSPAFGASFTNASPQPYDLYIYSQEFGGVVIDGNAPVTVNLGTAFPAVLVSQPIANPSALSFLSTDYIALNIDGVNIAAVPMAGLTTVLQVVTALNAAIDADVQLHKDGTGTFHSTAPNKLVTSTPFSGGSEALLEIHGRNVQSSALSGLYSNATVITPVGAGQTNGAPQVGLQSNNTSVGSYNSLDQPAQLIGSAVAPFNITTGVNDNLQLSVDGSQFGVTLPGGPAVPLNDVVEAINDAYLVVASPADVAAMTSSLLTVVNQVLVKYNTHLASVYPTGYHLYADSPTALAVTTVTNNAGLFEVQTTTAIPFPTGTTVNITGVVGTGGMTAAINQKWVVTILDATHMTLNGSVFVGAYTSGGDVTATYETLAAAVDLPSAITLVNDLATKYNVHVGEANPIGGGILSVTALGTLIEVQTNTAHGLVTGASVVITGVIGVNPANNVWLVTVVDGTHFTLQDSFFPVGDIYTSGGVVSVQTHQLSDSVNVVSAPTATNLQSAITLAFDLQQAFNAHLVQQGVHGYPDYINVEDFTNQSGTGITSITTSVGVSFTVNVSGGYTFTTGSYVYITGSTYAAINNQAWLINTGALGTFTVLFAGATGGPYVAGGTCVDDVTIQLLLNSTQTEVLAHFEDVGVPVFHQKNDTTNWTALTAIPAASDPVGGPYPTSANLANALKQYLNAHYIESGLHVENDVTNTITVANATSAFQTIVPLVDAIAYGTGAPGSTFGSYNNHRNQVEGLYSVHGTFDLVDASSAVLATLVASAGLGQYVGELVLTSRTNTPISQIAVLQQSTGNTPLGFTSGISASRVQPTATSIATALNNNTGFGSLAVAFAITVQGLGTYLELDSRSVGSTSTIAFTNIANSAFIPDAGLGIIPGTSGAIGENAIAGFQVSSSAGSAGSHGIGYPGQTYTDATTGLRFSVLPANTSAGYDNNGSFTMIVNTIFTCDGAIPSNAIPGMQFLVYNTLGMAPGTTGVVSTYPHKGFQPAIGDVYYISYQYGKTDLSPALFRDLKTIQMNFGAPTPGYPLSLGASLVLLNGAVIVGLSQVLPLPGQSQAPDAAYTAAIDVLRAPISGTVNADIITPLTTDPTVFTYLNQHCVFMSSPRQAAERTGVVGVAVGTTPLGVASIAQGLASELMMVVYPNSFVITVTDTNGNSTEQLVDGSFAAAALAGSTCNPAIDVATPITRRAILGFTSLGQILDPTTANQVAVSGVTIIEQVTTGMRIRQGLTTNLASVITRTPSVTLTIQYVQQTMRATLDPFIGNKLVNQTVININNMVTGMFGQLIDRQIVQSVSGISVAPSPTDPTIVTVQAIYVPVFPLEYIVATLQIQVSM
jgi:hypothetical protein